MLNDAQTVVAFCDVVGVPSTRADVLDTDFELNGFADIHRVGHVICNEFGNECGFFGVLRDGGHRCFACIGINNGDGLGERIAVPYTRRGIVDTEGQRVCTGSGRSVQERLVGVFTADSNAAAAAHFKVCTDRPGVRIAVCIVAREVELCCGICIAAALAIVLNDAQTVVAFCDVVGVPSARADVLDLDFELYRLADVHRVGHIVRKQFRHERRFACILRDGGQSCVFRRCVRVNDVDLLGECVLVPVAIRPPEAERQRLFAERSRCFEFGMECIGFAGLDFVVAGQIAVTREVVCICQRERETLIGIRLVEVGDGNANVLVRTVASVERGRASIFEVDLDRDRLTGSHGVRNVRRNIFRNVCRHFTLDDLRHIVRGAFRAFGVCNCFGKRQFETVQNLFCACKIRKHHRHSARFNGKVPLVRRDARTADAFSEQGEHVFLFAFCCFRGSEHITEEGIGFTGSDFHTACDAHTALAAALRGKIRVIQFHQTVDTCFAGFCRFGGNAEQGLIKQEVLSIGLPGDIARVLYGVVERRVFTLIERLGDVDLDEFSVKTRTVNSNIIGICENRAVIHILRHNGEGKRNRRTEGSAVCIFQTQFHGNALACFCQRRRAEAGVQIEVEQIVIAGIDDDATIKVQFIDQRGIVRSTGQGNVGDVAVGGQFGLNRTVGAIEAPSLAASIDQIENSRTLFAETDDARIVKRCDGAAEFACSADCDGGFKCVADGIAVSIDNLQFDIICICGCGSRDIERHGGVFAGVHSGSQCGIGGHTVDRDCEFVFVGCPIGAADVLHSSLHANGFAGSCGRGNIGVQDLRVNGFSIVFRSFSRLERFIRNFFRRAALDFDFLNVLRADVRFAVDDHNESDVIFTGLTRCFQVTREGIFFTGSDIIRQSKTALFGGQLLLASGVGEDTEDFFRLNAETAEGVCFKNLRARVLECDLEHTNFVRLHNGGQNAVKEVRVRRMRIRDVGRPCRAVCVERVGHQQGVGQTGVKIIHLRPYVGVGLDGLGRGRGGIFDFCFVQGRTECRDIAFARKKVRQIALDVTLLEAVFEHLQIQIVFLLADGETNGKQIFNAGNGRSDVCGGRNSLVPKNDAAIIVGEHLKHLPEAFDGHDVVFGKVAAVLQKAETIGFGTELIKPPPIHIHTVFLGIILVLFKVKEQFGVVTVDKTLQRRCQFEVVILTFGTLQRVDKGLQIKVIQGIILDLGGLCCLHGHERREHQHQCKKHRKKTFGVFHGFSSNFLTAFLQSPPKKMSIFF